MNNSVLQLKFKQRLNKIASNDYDNIECWQIIEAFNKAQISWCRRQLHGTNTFREGDEASKRRIDDLQILLTTVELTGADFAYDEKYGYFQSDNFNLIYDPTLGNYLEYKRIEVKAVQALDPVPPIPPEYIENKFAHYMFWTRCPAGTQDPCTVQEYKDWCSDWIETEDPAAWNQMTQLLDGADPLFGAFIATEDMIQDMLIDGCLDAPQYQVFDENNYGPYFDQTGDPTLVEGTGVEGIPGRIAPGASKEKCCREARTMTVYLSEVANTDILLRDPLKNPDFEWGETFCTFQDNEVRIWRKDFFVLHAHLIYYRKPVFIEIEGCIDPYTSQQSPADVECEFKDDIAELMIDEAISIIAGDISDPNQFQRGDSLMEKNN